MPLNVQIHEQKVTTQNPKQISDQKQQHKQNKRTLGFGSSWVSIKKSEHPPQSQLNGGLGALGPQPSSQTVLALQEQPPGRSHPARPPLLPERAEEKCQLDAEHFAKSQGRLLDYAAYREDAED